MQRFSIMLDAVQAAAYRSCLATIYEPDKARKLPGFPSDLHLRISISFGYPINAK